MTALRLRSYWLPETRRQLNNLTLLGVHRGTGSLRMLKKTLNSLVFPLHEPVKVALKACPLLFPGFESGRGY